MRTLALRGGARVAVVAAEWRDAFGVVTRGRVQLELRDGDGAHRHPKSQERRTPLRRPPNDGGRHERHE
ncbi:hypothetical protein [Actinomadura nitritigenes]|uniref:hypothetical protein n=1 Tax=Actinomadura nitritigenes TaxID=134602 RepID=UPI003D8E240D